MSRAIIASLLLLALPSLVNAQAWDRPQWFGSFELGNSQLDVEESDYIIDDSDTAFALRFGYQVNDHFSLVGGYADLGRFNTEFLAEDEDGNLIVSEQGSTSATAWMAHAELSREFLGFLHPNVGVGVARWRLDIPDDQHDNTEDTAPLVRLGLGIAIGGNARVDIFGQHIGRLEAVTAGIGLRFDF